MRVSNFLSRTLREDPSEVETISHRLMLRSGMMMQVASGVYSYLPLALRSLKKIEGIIREEMDMVGGQEVRMPALQPIEEWEATGRDAAFGENLFRLQDRRNRVLVLAPTHEEIVTQMVKSNISSYRDLPLLLYQIQTKFRDEPRPRAGLLRGREFDMKDAYSFAADMEGLDHFYRLMVAAYDNIFRRCGLTTITVEADSGAIGGKDSHEFIMPADSGEDLVLTCDGCGYGANVERATSVRPTVLGGDPSPLERVETPGIETIEAVVEFLGLPAARTLKAVFYKADDRVIMAVIRGDLDVNEVKLKNTLGVTELRLATTLESSQAGLTKGYTSPVGLDDVWKIGDLSIQDATNLVAGANQEGFHLKNTNYPRDFEVDQLADIAAASAGHGCPDCEQPLRQVRGIEVGHVFKLGTFFSETIGAFFSDDHGSQQPVAMGCYGIGVTRVLAAAIEQNHDDKGIVFPTPIAPFHIHLAALNVDNAQVAESAEKTYKDLAEWGYEVLFDDRQESAGVKFNDADLIGIPVRLIISARGLQHGTMELKTRRDGETRVVEPNDLRENLAELLSLSGA